MKLFPWTSKYDRVAISLCIVLALCIIAYFKFEDIALLLEGKSNYKAPNTILGYKLGEFIEDDSLIIETVSKPNEMPYDGVSGGIFIVKCLEDFGGLNFDSCRVIVSVNGIKMIIAKKDAVDHMEFKRALKRVNGFLGKPVSKGDNYSSWKSGNVNISLTYDPDKKGSNDVLFMFGQF